MYQSFITKVLAIMLIFSSLLMAEQFTDVPTGHWAEASIDRIVGMGIIAGYEDGTFRGTNKVNRFEFTIFVDTMLKVMDARYASKESQDEFLKNFQRFQYQYEADRKKYHRMTKDQWDRHVQDFEYIKAELSELRARVAS